MSDDQPPPALTAAQWREWIRGRDFEPMLVYERDGTLIVDDRFAAPGRHALAALCLYGQSFGFSQEDVRMLRMYSAMFDGERHGQFASLATRIANLLPPVPETRTPT